MKSRNKRIYHIAEGTSCSLHLHPPNPLLCNTHTRACTLTQLRFNETNACHEVHGYVPCNLINTRHACNVCFSVIVPTTHRANRCEGTEKQPCLHDFTNTRGKYMMHVWRKEKSGKNLTNWHSTPTGEYKMNSDESLIPSTRLVITGAYS